MSTTLDVLALVIALHEPDIGLQEEAMAALIAIPKAEREKVLDTLSSEPFPSLRESTRRVLERTL